MASAAPFVAHPVRRLAAGFVDLAAAVMSAGIVSALVQTVGFGWPELELALIMYTLYHLVFYALWGGQTPGLRLFGTKAVSAAGGNELSRIQILVRAGFRPLLLYVLGWTAYLVARHQFGVAAVMVLAPLLGELGMMLTLPSRQTLSDLASGTLVVKVPPPQPHRAPAAPMYSPTDAEFGVRPGKPRR